MASMKVRPTPPPGGPALVRPAVGALLLSLSGAACGDDDSGNDSMNDSQPPMVLDEEGPMPNPTTDQPPMSGLGTEDPPMPPMIDPTSGGVDSSTSGDGTTSGPPPMPNPTEGSSSGSDSGSDSGSSGPIPPMPPPDPGAGGGAVPEDDQEF